MITFSIWLIILIVVNYNCMRDFGLIIIIVEIDFRSGCCDYSILFIVCFFFVLILFNLILLFVSRCFVYLLFVMFFKYSFVFVVFVVFCGFYGDVCRLYYQRRNRLEALPLFCSIAVDTFSFVCMCLFCLFVVVYVCVYFLLFLFL